MHKIREKNTKFFCFRPQLNMKIKFPVQKVGFKKKSGFCFSDLLYKTLQQVRKYVFANLRYQKK